LTWIESLWDAYLSISRPGSQAGDKFALWLNEMRSAESPRQCFMARTSI
jgi:hypothetical protein